ncbi:hypothetical protein [Bifidobacterium sp. ESL0745]|uniref:hypothetical protein n=1 Tax=Bifidobacterium sp. ESL0745 TaxID=2983226 RepID=UPI0023F87C2E|nr:hypothetical protein [Bifidobacterium sp. ESL0745]MDF7666119.1 hypothetical protein [Bifidobacterium sp. ESL0745]
MPSGTDRPSDPKDEGDDGRHTDVSVAPVVIALVLLAIAVARLMLRAMVIYS